MDKWSEEPWYKSTSERITDRFLTEWPRRNFPWGYIIYQTVYTPESVADHHGKDDSRYKQMDER